ncbi:MAG: patatin-like phospholipase family protein, partial [Steroidobacteraceae bacterium]
MNAQAATLSEGAERTNSGVPLECDLVMKGGITSGVIYPRLVYQLSKQYRFRSIGGTSAGAIAAAAAAAAQLGVLSGTRKDAFDRLNKLPEELGAAATGAQGSMLLNLFQPQKAFRRHFALVKVALNSPSKFRLISRVATNAIVRFPLGAVLGAAVGTLIFFTSEGIAHWLGALLALAGLVLGAFLATAITLLKSLPGNVFGLCSGMPGHAGAPPALTTWLNEYLNDLAGKSTGEPLTFGELWAGRLRGVGEQSPHTGKGRKEVELAMMTTALNPQRPFRLPFESANFFFLEEDMKRFFPDTVVQWMKGHSRKSDAADSLSSGDRRFYALPQAPDMPILIGVRMSLSFPILLSAVPLYTVDWTLKANAGKATQATRVLFSDGGICSNFPIHFFDGPLPSRPTFGVDLGDFHPDYPTERVWLPQVRKGGQGVNTYIPPMSEQPGLGSVVGFVSAIMNTMQNWNDQLQIGMPGFRDRIVHISHSEDEGGLNLNMPAPTIETLANSGGDAAGELVTAFARPDPQGKPNAWDNHRRIRVRSLLSTIYQQALRLHDAIDRTELPTWRSVVEASDPPSYPY